MRDAVMVHPIASKLFTGGVAEETAIWNDPRTGLLCKARLDYHQRERAIVTDLKSTEDASPGAFARSVVNYRYHVQHAHYADAFAATDHELRMFAFVAVEKSAPYAVAVYTIDADAEARGMELRERDMDLLTQCLQTDTWPGYPTGINRLSLPNWAMRD
jgi:exodeoxyribonuclease VIII